MATPSNWQHWVERHGAYITHMQDDLIPMPTEGKDAREVMGPYSTWLAPNACLLQSHLPLPEGSGPVIQVVGVADSHDWPGYVLMLD